MPLPSSFWTDPPIYCKECYTLHHEQLPHRCDCGHDMKEPTRQVTFEQVVLGRIHYVALSYIMNEEDRNVLALLEGACDAAP